MGVSRRFLVKLTATEQALMGRTVIAMRNIPYGCTQCKQVFQGSTGKIVDFGATSGDPCIQWSDSFRAIAEFGRDVELVT